MNKAIILLLAGLAVGTIVIFANQKLKSVSEDPLFIG
jgi:hypothetical protein